MPLRACGVMIIIFLSTPSARRATDQVHRGELAGSISIHALREEGDSASPSLWMMRANFYPRPPRGGRPRRHLA